MKRILSLLLLLSVVGIALADISPERRLPQPPVNRPDAWVNQIWLAPWARALMPFVSPSWRQVGPSYRAPGKQVPVPPVCGVSCYLRPIQAIAE